MALHGMGKIYNTIAKRRDGDVQARRKAMTMFLAAISARPENHLAANELGVLLAENGHYAEAANMFQQSARLQPSSTAYHNLSWVQRKLGQELLATNNETQSSQLAEWEYATGAVSRRKGVQWVSSDELAHVGNPPREPAADQPNAEQMAAAATQQGMAAGAPRKSAWQRAVDMARSLPLPLNGDRSAALEDVPSGPAPYMQTYPTPANRPPATDADSTFWR